MISSAWYMVSEYKLNLGPSDTLEKTVLHISEVSKLTNNSKKDEIKKFLINTNDKEIIKNKKILTKNVPYRLMKPLIDNCKNSMFHDTDDIVSTINKNTYLIYRFNDESGLNRKITINDEWFEYLKDNSEVINGWIDYNLIKYLQKRNPSVPGIINKLYPPIERKLTDVINYWKEVMKHIPILDIYTGNQLDNSISIDHFIPWSYVSHDELWDLIPTKKNTNSAKSNNLPDWNTYFDKLAKTEFDALQITKSEDDAKLKKLFEKALDNNVTDERIKNELYRKDRTLMEFTNVLKDVMLPVYDSAKNMGFNIWKITN